MHFWIFPDGVEFLLKVPTFAKETQAMSNFWMIQMEFRHGTNERGVFISYNRPQNTGDSMPTVILWNSEEFDMCEQVRLKPS
jgi:hypothetical protein